MVILREVAHNERIRGPSTAEHEIAGGQPGSNCGQSRTMCPDFSEQDAPPFCQTKVANLACLGRTFLRSLGSRISRVGLGLALGVR